MPITMTPPRSRSNGRTGSARPINNFAAYANALIGAATKDPDAIASIQAAAPSAYGRESVGADGGFAVPDSLLDRVAVRVREQGGLAELCDVVDAPESSVAAVQDDSTPWGTTGVIASWESEAAQHTPRKPSLSVRREQLHKLVALIPVTAELREDAPVLGRYLERKVAATVAYMLNRAIIAGDGIGKPLGILNAPGTIETAKDSGQTADTISEGNIVNMWSALSASSKRSPSLRWLAHPDSESQIWALDTRAIDSRTRTIMGAGVVVTEACEKLGDKGDLFLADLREYFMPTRTMAVIESIHLWFDYTVSAFRMTLRCAGAPWNGAAVTSRVGGNTRSPFVVLAERA